jgi:phenylpropionate dioxygenase-like ring-hydroxylating dioxygenase large terminal subunit
MLSHDKNQLLCRVGRDTPMGNLMRQYWIPALPSREFPRPDCKPLRMRLLGENFVMFRDSDGRMGAIEENCPHRGASLYFGRNEEGGLRCAYHGWKFDVSGKCLAAPTEQPEREERFRTKIRARTYPCHEVNKMVWVYMGPRETPPPFPEFEVNTLPDGFVAEPIIMMEEANWMQNMEGDLDSAHLDWVHRRLREDSEPPDVGSPGFWNPTGRPPLLDVVPTNYGAFYSARREMPDGTEWHRINQFIFPFHTMITIGDGTINLRSFIPLDDEYTMLIHQAAHPCHTPVVRGIEGYGFEEIGGFVDRTSDPRTYYMTKANKRNDYGRDMKLQSEKMFVGIPFVGNLPDRAMTELMSDDNGHPIYDRSREHLSSSDAMVIAVRRQLINAATRLRDEGKAPENVDDARLSRVRAITARLEKAADWKGETEKDREVKKNQPSRSDLGLIQ